MEVATAAICVSDNNFQNHQKPAPDQTETTRVVGNQNHHSILKPLTFTNGVLKRHGNAKNAAAVIVAGGVAVGGGGGVGNVYKECLKNHAASLGGHALDGCGEFMPSPNSSPTNPVSLKCAACGCHRNFHRRDPDDLHPLVAQQTVATQVIEYQPHHRHHPPAPSPVSAPAPLRRHSPSPPSPPPISSSYYPSSAPHMLLALSSGGLQNPPPVTTPTVPALVPPENSQSMNLFTPNSNPNSLTMTPNGRKRFRTKFSAGQKEKMLDFAERVGWKMQKRDEEIVADFCNEIGVEKNVLKVWMHNNKSKSASDHLHIQQHGNSNGNSTGNGNGVIRNLNDHITPININSIVQNHLSMNMNTNIVDDDDDDDEEDDDDDEDLTSPHLATNGSSSSS